MAGTVRAARFLAALWAGTSLLYLLHPQAAVPLVVLPGEKILSTTAGMLVSLIVAFFPANAAALLAAFAVSSLSCLGWHSWLGAYQPLVPAGFLFLVFFHRSEGAEASKALLWTFALGMAANAAHRLNGAFLAGQEFSPGGTLARDLPTFLLGPQGIAGGPGPWAAAWLLTGVLPAALFPFSRKAAGWAFVGACLLSLMLYKVLFYGFFLVVPALVLFDPGYLREWRKGASRFRPEHLYCASLVIFLAWYLLLREHFWAYLLAVGAGLGAAAGARFSPGPEKRKKGAGRRALPWLIVWAAYLALPFFFPSMPAPFALTQFSSREARFPPEQQRENWRGFRSCEQLKNDYALRWGVRMWQDGPVCRLALFRHVP